MIQSHKYPMSISRHFSEVVLALEALQETY
jgi:hypothetical protein